MTDRASGNQGLLHVRMGTTMSCSASTEENVVLHFLSFSILEGAPYTGRWDPPTPDPFSRLCVIAYALAGHNKTFCDASGRTHVASSAFGTSADASSAGHQWLKTSSERSSSAGRSSSADSSSAGASCGHRAAERTGVWERQEQYGQKQLGRSASQLQDYSR